MQIHTIMVSRFWLIYLIGIRLTRIITIDQPPNYIYQFITLTHKIYVKNAFPAISDLPNIHMVSPPPSLRRSPRGNVKGGSSSSVQSSSTGQSANASSSNRTRTLFSASLDQALSLSHQPSTSQSSSGLGAILSAGPASATNLTNPTVKLNKSILTSSALAAAAADNGVNVVNLVHGSGSNSGASSTSAGTSGSGAQLQGFSGSGGQAAADPDTDDADVGRLQALLEARGIPPHVFGSLGKRYFS